MLMKHGKVPIGKQLSDTSKFASAKARKEALQWAAAWIVESARINSNEAVMAFAENMAETLRAELKRRDAAPSSPKEG